MLTSTLRRVHLNAFVDADVREELERLAREADRSLSAEIRRALAAHIERETTDEGDDHEWHLDGSANRQKA